MIRGRKPLDEEELEDTKEVEVPTETEACDPSTKPCQEDPNAFTACITLESELILGKSFPEIFNVFDARVKEIREAAVAKVNEIRK